MVGLEYPNAWAKCAINRTRYPDSPEPRMYASFARVAYNGDAAVLLGGHGANQVVFNDTWLLVFDGIALDGNAWPTCGWRKLTIVGDAPSTLGAASLRTIPPGHPLKNDLILFGGCASGAVFRESQQTCSDPSNETMVVDLLAGPNGPPTLEFKRLNSTGDVTNASFGQLVVTKDSVHLIGGTRLNGTDHDLFQMTGWRAEVVNSSLQWERLQPSDRLLVFYGLPSVGWDEDNDAILIAGVLNATTKVCL